MKTLLVFSFFLATTTASSLDTLQLDNVEINGRITNGRKATEGQFPYVVGLLVDPKLSWCGGSLIGKEWVLTVAHCLKGSKRGATVYLGATDRRRAEKTYYVKKEQFHIHPNYNDKTFENDIALIKIPAATLSKKIKTIKLPSIHVKPHSKYVGKFAIASGWGRTSDKATKATPQLQWARFKIISNKDCMRIYFDLADSTMCIATPGRVSPCVGDSGGPLALQTEEILIGVTSSQNENGCELGDPAVFTRLTDYLDWIQSISGISY